MNKEKKLITNREVKSSAFAAYFGEPKNAAKLFEALEPGSHISPNDIDFTTLNGVLFLARKNDLAFTVKKKVLVISEHQHPILEICRPLYEYSWFIQRVKDYLDTGNNRDEAITQAIHDCLEAEIMKDFLVEHGSEAINMIFTEFNMEDALEVRFEEGVETGIERGIDQGKRELLITQIEKKLAKGKSLETIAEELEENIDVIKELIK